MFVNLKNHFSNPAISNRMISYSLSLNWERTKLLAYCLLKKSHSSKIKSL